MTSDSSLWDELPLPIRRALAVVLNQDMPADSLALYARWWQLETWLRSLAYVELRAQDGVNWVNNLDKGTVDRQTRDQSYSYMASPDWEDPLAYLDTSKLFELVTSRWDLFDGQLIELKAWEGRREELIKIRHRLGHLRRPHIDDLSRLTQTLRDLDQGANNALSAYHRGYDPTVICHEDDPVVAGWIKGEHADADRLIEHAANAYGTTLEITLAARPWAEVPTEGEKIAPGSSGFVWRVEFWMRDRYLRIPELWRAGRLDRKARRLLIHMLVTDRSSVTVTFPMVDDGNEISDAIGNLFDAVLLNSSSRYPGDPDDLGNSDYERLQQLPPLDPRVQVSSMWAIQVPDDAPVTVFSA